MSRKALGKGLGALIPEKTKAGEIGVSLIPVDQISPNPYQPRKKFLEDSLAGLVESIKSRGLLQPIIVKRSAAGYELIAGERRWRASAQAGLKQIPALIKEAGREDSLAIALIENIQRENLNPIDAAMAYRSLTDEFNLSQEQIASLVGKDRATVANFMRLLKLPQAIQEDLADLRLTMGHARALLALSDRERQLKVRDVVIDHGYSVRETEKLVNRISKAKKGPRNSRAHRDPHLSSIEEDLKRGLGTKVLVKQKGNGGTIQIHYHSPEELDRLLELLLTSDKQLTRE